jgi:azurin
MLTRILLPFGLSFLLLAGCGKSENAPAATASVPSAPVKPAMPVFEIKGDDSMKYSLTRIEVKAGQEIQIVLSNAGNLPKAAMGHNLVILKKDAELKAFTDAAVMAAATDYIPASQADKIIAHTKLLGPKQSDTITFKAPAEPGEYPYFCSFPGHSALMKGVLVVQ